MAATADDYQARLQAFKRLAAEVPGRVDAPRPSRLDLSPLAGIPVAEQHQALADELRHIQRRLEYLARQDRITWPFYNVRLRALRGAVHTLQQLAEQGDTE